MSIPHGDVYPPVDPYGDDHDDVIGDGTVTTIPDEARWLIPATAKAIHAEMVRCSHDPLGDDCRYLAHAALTAAYPLLRKEIADQIAEAIEAQDPIEAALAGMDAWVDAAAVARSFGCGNQ